MEGDRFDAPGGKREAKVEEDQAAAAIQAKHRAAARRRKKKQEQEKAGSVEEQKAVKPLFGGKAGFGTPKEDDFAGSKDRNKSLEIRKKMQQRERSKRQAAAEQAAKAGMPADLRAALAIQRRWRERQFRLGKRSSARAKPKAGIKSDGTKANSRKTPEELEQERAAARIQASKRGADARRATRGQRGGVAASMSFLDSEASRKAEAEMALAKASSTIARFYRRFARKRNGRRWVKEETRRRHEAASKVQAARRGQRIRRHIGYRGTTEGEYGRPHGFGRMIWPDGSSFSGEWVEGVMEGEGEMVWHDGSCFEGDWSEGKRHGKGVYEDVSGSVFDGQWVHGVFQGEGTRTLPNGTLMEGQWEGDCLTCASARRGTHSTHTPDPTSTAWRAFPDAVSTPAALKLNLTPPSLSSPPLSLLAPSLSLLALSLSSPLSPPHAGGHWRRRQAAYCTAPGARRSGAKTAPNGTTSTRGSGSTASARAQESRSPSKAVTRACGATTGGTAWASSWIVMGGPTVASGATASARGRACCRRPWATASLANGTTTTCRTAR